MHIVKNFYENILDVSGKIKNNEKARLDLEELCASDELHLCIRKNGNSYKPKAKFSSSLQWKGSLCAVSLLGGYSSNFSNKVDSLFTKLQNMKAHDYHVFMEALLPIAFNALPVDMLEPLLALGEFFKNLRTNVLHEDLLMKMHRNIAVILCNLKIIVSPGFWNVMEHLPLHFGIRSSLGWSNLLPMDVPI